VRIIPTPQNDTAAQDLTPIAPVLHAAQHLPFDEELEEDDGTVPIQHLPFLEESSEPDIIPIQDITPISREVPDPVPIVPVLHAAQHLPFNEAEIPPIVPVLHAAQHLPFNEAEIPPIVPVLHTAQHLPFNEAEIPPIVPVLHAAQHLPFNEAEVDYPIQPEPLSEELEEYPTEYVEYPIEDMFEGDDGTVPIIPGIPEIANQDITPIGDDGTVPISDEEYQLENQDITPIDEGDIFDDDYSIMPQELPPPVPIMTAEELPPIIPVDELPPPVPISLNLMARQEGCEKDGDDHCSKYSDNNLDKYCKDAATGVPEVCCASCKGHV